MLINLKLFKTIKRINELATIKLSIILSLLIFFILTIPSYGQEECPFGMVWDPYLMECVISESDGQEECPFGMFWDEYLMECVDSESESGCKMVIDWSIAGTKFWYECNGQRVTQIANGDAPFFECISDFTVQDDKAYWKFIWGWPGSLAYYYNSISDPWYTPIIITQVASGVVPGATEIVDFQFLGSRAVWAFSEVYSTYPSYNTGYYYTKCTPFPPIENLTIERITNFSWLDDINLWFCEDEAIWTDNNGDHFKEMPPCCCIDPPEDTGDSVEEWVVKYAGPAHRQDYPVDMTVDQNGNVYVVGESWGEHNDYDIIILKYDSQGNTDWTARYDEGDSEFVSAVAVDDLGNVFVTGNVFSYGGLNSYDCLTIKYDHEGNQLWVAKYDGPSNEYDSGEDIALDDEGNVYIVGFVDLGSDMNEDMVVIKYDTNGTQIWDIIYNGLGDFSVDRGIAISVDNEGNVFVLGESSLCEGGEPSGNVIFSETVTIKYDGSGNQQWISKYDSIYNTNKSSMVIDKAGNVYVTGDPYTTIKYNSNGLQEWVVNYHGPSCPWYISDRAHALAVDAGGNVYVTGESWFCSPYGAEMNTDYATVKYNPYGEQIWVAGYDGPRGQGDDDAYAIVLDESSNSVYVTGNSQGCGSADMVTVKYDLNTGRQLWVRRYKDLGHSYSGHSCSCSDSNGNVFISGGIDQKVCNLEYQSTYHFTDIETIKLVSGSSSFPDTDGDGLLDDIEDANHNGIFDFDQGETNPYDADTDNDGLVDGNVGSEDLNANGIFDPGETDPTNPDTDGDGIFDGTERGLTAPETADTDVSAGFFVADTDPSTTTDPTDADGDDDGILDGNEDKNHDGLVDPLAGETDPGNPDSDGDGIYDGTEMGLTEPQDAEATDLLQGHFVPDSDPASTTDPTSSDSDGDGTGDGDEDVNKDGLFSPELGETDPNSAAGIRGDLDDDGDIDSADYNLFRSTLGKCSGDAGFIAEADYDEDGCVTYADYRIWYGYYRNQ